MLTSNQNISHTVMKEFTYGPGGIQVRLVAGFENDVLAYHAVQRKTGMNLPPLSEDSNKIEAQVFGGNLTEYIKADSAFRTAVQELL